ncbi:putative methyltransferase NSUN7 [Liparis tanakae]|uniref:Putative methyltransferase NSUN7 n=1 Tax=Liparis tanakae TaxID=230148 RepID=A0A4Z2HXD0_9TELE|nr:putative methyltransferase NSUN7 [Liparis tanakae]
MPDQAEGPTKTPPFFTLEPSEQSNGCFLAVLSREPEPEVREEPQEVIVRANAKGILDRIGSSQLTRKEQRQADRMPHTTQARTSQPHLSARIYSRSQEIVGSHSTTVCARPELTNRRQSSQGKAKAMPMQASKDTVHSSFPSSKPQSNAAKKSIPPVSYTPPAPPLPAPLARPRRARQEALKPVVLVLPRVHFPNFFPPQLSRRASGPNFDSILSMRDRTPRFTLVVTRRVTESAEGEEEEHARWEGGRATRHFWYRS